MARCCGEVGGWVGERGEQRRWVGGWTYLGVGVAEDEEATETKDDGGSERGHARGNEPREDNGRDAFVRGPDLRMGGWVGGLKGRQGGLHELCWVGWKDVP